MISDQQHDADVLAINAASAAIMTSPIPWNGPIGAVRITVSSDGRATLGGRLPGNGGESEAATASSFVGDDASSQQESPCAPPRLRLLVAGTVDHIVMLEAEVLLLCVGGWQCVL